MGALPNGLQLHVLRGSGPVALQPDRPACVPTSDMAWRLAVVKGCLPYGSVHEVMSSLTRELVRLGFDAREIGPDDAVHEDEAVVAWGHHNLRKRLSRSAGGRVPIALIDPVDGWAIRPAEIEEKSALCHAVFGLSRHSCDALVTLGMPKDRVKRLRLGVDLSVFRPTTGRPLEPTEAASWSNQPGRRIGRFVFLHCGFLGQPRKGTAELVQAFCHAFRSGDDVSLVIKGNHEGWGADIRDLLVRLGSHAGAPHVVYTWDRIDRKDMAALYSAADCVVAPSRLEGFGLVALEAMACGVPVIATDATGHAEYVTGENALVVPVVEEPLRYAAAQVYGETLLRPEWRAIGERRPKWACIDVAGLARCLRRAYERPCEARSRVEAGLRTARQFSWSRAALDLVQGLGEVGVRVRRRPGRLVATEEHTAIVIAAHNCADDLDRCLESLARLSAGAPFVGVIVDDGSRDHTRRVISRWAKCLALTVLHHARRRGVVASRIAATRALRDIGPVDYVCYLDSDVRCDDPEWLHRFIEAHIDGISGPKLLWDREPGGVGEAEIWAAGAELLGPPDYAGCRGYGYRAGPEFDIAREVDGVPGACMFMRRDLLDRVRWDAGYAGYGYEDIDLCLQVTRGLGEHAWYWPHIVLHHHAGSYARGSARGAHVEEFHASRERFVRKWGLAVAGPETRRHGGVR